MIKAELLLDALLSSVHENHSRAFGGVHGISDDVGEINGAII